MKFEIIAELRIDTVGLAAYYDFSDGTMTALNRKANEMNDSNKMTKTELERWHVEQGVAKWGEKERAGLEKQAAKKSLAALRYDYDTVEYDTGRMSYQEMIDRAAARETGPVRYQAAHCNDDGPT